MVFYLFLVLRKLANFPEKVVLLEPCKPDIKIKDVFSDKLTPLTSSPIKSVNSSFEIFTNNCHSCKEVNTF